MKQRNHKNRKEHHPSPPAPRPVRDWSDERILQEVDDILSREPFADLPQSVTELFVRPEEAQSSERHPERSAAESKDPSSPVQSSEFKVQSSDPVGAALSRPPVSEPADVSPDAVGRHDPMPPDVTTTVSDQRRAESARPTQETPADPVGAVIGRPHDAEVQSSERSAQSSDPVGTALSRPPVSESADAPTNAVGRHDPMPPDVTTTVSDQRRADSARPTQETPADPVGAVIGRPPEAEAQTSKPAPAAQRGRRAEAMSVSEIFDYFGLPRDPKNETRQEASPDLEETRLADLSPELLKLGRDPRQSSRYPADTGPLPTLEELFGTEEEVQRSERSAQSSDSVGTALSRPPVSEPADIPPDAVGRHDPMPPDVTTSATDQRRAESARPTQETPADAVGSDARIAPVITLGDDAAARQRQRQQGMSPDGEPTKEPAQDAPAEEKKLSPLAKLLRKLERSFEPEEPEDLEEPEESEQRETPEPDEAPETVSLPAPEEAAKQEEKPAPEASPELREPRQTPGGGLSRISGALNPQLQRVGGWFRSLFHYDPTEEDLEAEVQSSERSVQSSVGGGVPDAPDASKTADIPTDAVGRHDPMPPDVTTSATDQRRAESARPTQETPADAVGAVIGRPSEAETADAAEAPAERPPEEAQEEWDPLSLFGSSESDEGLVQWEELIRRHKAPDPAPEELPTVPMDLNAPEQTVPMKLGEAEAQSPAGGGVPDAPDASKTADIPTDAVGRHDPMPPDVTTSATDRRRAESARPTQETPTDAVGAVIGRPPVSETADVATDAVGAVIGRPPVSETAELPADAAKSDNAQAGIQPNYEQPNNEQPNEQTDNPQPGETAAVSGDTVDGIPQAVLSSLTWRVRTPGRRGQDSILTVQDFLAAAVPMEDAEPPKPEPPKPPVPKKKWWQKLRAPKLELWTAPEAEVQRSERSAQSSDPVGTALSRPPVSEPADVSPDAVGRHDPMPPDVTTTVSDQRQAESARPTQETPPDAVGRHDPMPPDVTASATDQRRAESARPTQETPADAAGSDARIPPVIAQGDDAAARQRRRHQGMPPYGGQTEAPAQSDPPEVVSADAGPKAEGRYGRRGARGEDAPVPSADTRTETLPRESARPKRRENPPVELLPPEGPELRSPEEAYRHYAKPLDAIGTRLILTGLFTILSLFFTLYQGQGWSFLPEIFSGGTTAYILLALLLVMVLVNRDLYLRRWRGEKGLRPELLIVLATVFTALDSFRAAQTLRAPFTVVVGALLLMELWGRYDRGLALTTTLKVLREEPLYAGVSEVQDITKDRRGLVRTAPDVDSFMEKLETRDLVDRVMGIYAPAAAVGGLILTLLISIGLKQDFLWTGSLVFLGSVPVTGLLAFPRLFALLATRLAGAQAALCGYHGAEVFGGEHSILIGDDDIFPAGSLTLNGFKVYNGNPDRLIAYAAAAVRSSGSALHPVFDDLLVTHNGRHFTVDEFRFYDSGGIGASIQQEVVLMGSLDFMRRMGVHMDRGAKVKQAVYMSLNGELAAVFAIRYTPPENLRRGLAAIAGNRHFKGILVTRTFLGTPGFLKSRFGIPTSAFAYPSTQERIRLSEAEIKRSGAQGAILARDSFSGFAQAAAGGRMLRSATLGAAVLAVLGGLLGLILMGILAALPAYETATALNLLLYTAAWLAPTLLLTSWARHF